jgi:hypothetical protein
MSTSRNTSPLYEGIRSLVLSARQSADRAGCGKELANELAARLTAAVPQHATHGSPRSLAAVS